MCWERLLQSCISRTGIIIIWCNVLDVLSTFYALTWLNAYEANPIANYLLSIGWLPALAYKAVGTVIVCYLMLLIREQYPKVHLHALMILVVSYLLIFVNNMGVFLWLTA